MSLTFKGIMQGIDENDDRNAAMFDWFRRKPNVVIQLPDFNRGNMVVQAHSFKLKVDATVDYMTNHYNRLSLLMDDFYMLVKDSRIANMPVTIDIVDKDSKPLALNNEFKYSDQRLSVQTSLKPLGYMQFKGYTSVDTDETVLTGFHVKSSIYNPATLVHELAHLVDVSKGDSKNVLFSTAQHGEFASSNVPSFDSVVAAYHYGLIDMIYQNRSDIQSKEQATDFILSDPHCLYLATSTEIHSRLFERFYALDIEAYRDYDGKIENIYCYDNPEYSPQADIQLGMLVADNVYQNDGVRDWFMREYSEIIPETHPEKNKYMGQKRMLDQSKPVSQNTFKNIGLTTTVSKTIDSDMDFDL